MKWESRIIRTRNLRYRFYAFRVLWRCNFPNSTLSRSFKVEISNSLLLREALKSKFLTLTNGQRRVHLLQFSNKKCVLSASKNNLFGRWSARRNRWKHANEKFKTSIIKFCRNCESNSVSLTCVARNVRTF